MSEYYDVCPKCGANLDPGEICNCSKESDERMETIKEMSVIPKEKGGQIEFVVPRPWGYWR